MTEEINLVRKMVWSYVRSNPGLEFDDLFSEACLAYLESAKYYDPTRGAKTTFVWYVVRSRLNNLLRKHGKQTSMEVLTEQLPDLESAPSPEQLLLRQERWQDLIASLSPEAQTVVDLLMSDDITLPVQTPRKARGMLAAELHKRGWQGPTIWSAFREIKSVLTV